MAIIRGSIIIVLSFLVAYYGASMGYHLFSSSLDYGIFAWIVAIYSLTVSLLFTIFEEKHPYVWVIVAIAPLLFLFLRLVLPPLEFITSFNLGDSAYLLLGWSVFIVVGIGSGVVIKKILMRFSPKFLTRLSS